MTAKRERETARQNTARGIGLLSMHRPTPTPPRRGAVVRPRPVGPLLGGVRGGFMVPMHAKKRKRALHEPTHPRLLSPVRWRAFWLNRRQFSSPN